MTGIPAAAVAALAAGLDDYRRTTPTEQQTPYAAAERAAEYLASSGWTLHIEDDQTADDQPRRVPVLTVWIDGARTSPAVGDAAATAPPAPGPPEPRTSGSTSPRAYPRSNP